MAATERSEAATRSEAQKSGLSPDRSLKPDSVKLESLVIAHQHGAVNTFPGLVQIRSRALYTPPVTPSEWSAPEAGSPTARRTLSKARFVRGVKS